MKSLLLIEDDKQLSHMYAKKFSAEGWDVVICHNGTDAIQISKSKNHDAIVLDLMLPGISGVDVLEILRSEPKTVKTPVIVYTNFGDNYNREKCLSYGADDFVLKVDSTPDALVSVVKKALLLKEELNA